MNIRHNQLAQLHLRRHRMQLPTEHSFFFSSRRRHTRLVSDWSSDVCSSDLATMTANESANALVITATQSDVRRMAEIVGALDDSISGNSSVKVFALRFADAKDLATVIKELFQPAQQTQGNRVGGGGFGGGGFGGGGFGGQGGGGFGGPGGGNGGGNFGGRNRP